MNCVRYTVFLPFLSVLSFLTFADTPRSCAVRELNELRFSSDSPGEFLVTGTIQRVGHSVDNFVIATIEDETGRCFIKLDRSLTAPALGDRVEIICKKEQRADHDKILLATSLSVIGTGPISQPLRLSLGEINDRLHDNYGIETEGLVVDIIPDEIDPHYTVLLLKDGATQIPLFIHSEIKNADLLGARIRILADYRRLVSGQRRFSGPFLDGILDNVHVVRPPADERSVPSIDPSDYLTPAEVVAMGKRSIVGDVLAVWGNDNVMLNASNIIVNARLTRAAPLPGVGDVIRLVGYPETDLYKINLVKASWTRLATRAKTDEEPTITSINRIVRESGSKSAFNHASNGQLVRLSGIVQDCPANANAEQRLSVDIDGRRVPVDISSCPIVIRDVSVGCEIEVTGRCLMEIAPWRQYDVFPQIRGFAIIARSADDIKILKYPPWWTSGRLFGLVIALVLLLTGTVIWNRFLNRLVERRGKQLFRADIQRASEALRVEERTRLAVELHDSLSQNLTGVALQIKAGRHDLAARALKSCREELRNCLWDLRNNAIDCTSMDDAIRQTLEPHVEDISLNVRFNVPRNALSDNTAYAILRIIRELVTNAIRHGGAANVRVAGSLEPHRLLFSVRDDGCGFDPDHRPGIDEGHFGLQGVYERTAALGGEVSIVSQTGTGTKVTVSLPIAATTQPLQTT